MFNKGLTLVFKPFLKLLIFSFTNIISSCYKYQVGKNDSNNSAVVVMFIVSPPSFSIYVPVGVKNDVGRGLHISITTTALVTIPCYY